MKPYLSWLIRAGLVVVMAVALVVSGFASLETLAGPYILGNPKPGANASQFWFLSALSVLLALHVVASWLARRDTAHGRLLRWMIVGVSAAGALWSGWLALLSVMFWSAARADVSVFAILITGVLFFAAVAGPSVASFVAALVAVLVRSRPAPVLLPAAVFLVVAGAAIALPIVTGARSTGR